MRAAGEGPREAGIDGQCESAREADTLRDNSFRRSKEAEVLRRYFVLPISFLSASMLRSCSCTAWR